MAAGGDEGDTDIDAEEEIEELDPEEEPVEPTVAKMTFVDSEGQSLANVCLQVLLPDGSEEELVTDEKGCVEVEDLPPDSSIQILGVQDEDGNPLEVLPE